MNSPTVTYFEHYPHYAMGTMNTQFTMTIEEFVLLVLMRLESKALYEAAAKMSKGTKKAAMMSREAYDILEVFDDLIEARIQETSSKTAYATLETFETYKTVNGFINALAKKGYIVAEWEEGSFYFALNGFERVAKKELALMEAKIELDMGELD